MTAAFFCLTREAGDSQRNFLKHNKIGAKSTALTNRRNLVTYNNKLVTKPENEAIYLTARAVRHFERGLTISSATRPTIQLTNP
jgi:hypothetical protein